MRICPVDYRLTQPLALCAQFEIRGLTALLGRSGAGKTSLLKALAGLIPATGTPGSELPPEARAVGYLPQNFALFPHLTALQNVAYPLRGRQRLAQARALLSELNLLHLADRPALALSSGQAQRVALARALARRPRLLLLDEPSAALDALTRREMLEFLSETIARHDIPTLIATHDPAIAGAADWIALLAAQKIIAQGPPAQLFAAPRSVAAAELLGFENIWRQDGSFYAVRADMITLSAQGIQAIVTAIRNQGAGLRVECKAPQTLIFTLTTPPPVPLAPGQTIHLDFCACPLREAV